MSEVCKEVPQLAKAMILLINVFDKYAKKDGDADSLSQGEFSDLVKAELILRASDKAKVDEFFNLQLDADKNRTISFPEFMVFTAAITAAMKKMK